MKKKKKTTLFFQELTEQLACNTKLEEDLQRAKELAESAQAQYDKLQVRNRKPDFFYKVELNRTCTGIESSRKRSFGL